MGSDIIAFLMPPATTLVFFAFICWRIRVRQQPIHVRTTWFVALSFQIAVGVFLGCTGIGTEISLRLNPADDWHRLAGVGMGLINLVAAPFVAFAVGMVAHFWRHRRFPPGHCSRCGYDLTGNVSGKCPECGAAILAGAAVS